VNQQEKIVEEQKIEGEGLSQKLEEIAISKPEEN
jgi:hypothetical protein